MEWEIIVLDSELNYIGSLYDYESFIWNSRFKEPGDFELYFGNSESAFDLLKIDNFIYCKKIDEVTKKIIPYNNKNQYINEFSHGYPLMIVENLETEYSVENGIHLKVTGRSAEVILERRISYVAMVFSGDRYDILSAIIPSYFMTNITSPRGPKYFFKKDTTSPIALFPQISTGMSQQYLYLSNDIDGQGTPETLITNPYSTFYDVFLYLSNRFGYGMRLCILDNGYPQFQFYFPVDRTIEKGHSLWTYENESPIIFSDKDGSTISSSYKINYENYRNNEYCSVRYSGAYTRHVVAYPENERSVPNHKQRWIYDNNIPEMTYETDGSSNTQVAYMRSYMRYILATQYTPITEFEMEFDTENSQYKINKDYYLGDYVQVENSYGISAVAQVTEVLYSVSASDGFRIIPKFEIIQ